MYVRPPTNFLEFVGIDTEGFIKAFALNWFLKFAWNRLQIPSRFKKYRHKLGIFKHNLLLDYVGWKISRKRGYDSGALTKTQLQYLVIRLGTEIERDPDSSTKEARQLFARMFHKAYPEEFKKLFGETIPEKTARFNIEKFFQTVFA